MVLVFLVVNQTDPFLITIQHQPKSMPDPIHLISPTLAQSTSQPTPQKNNTPRPYYSLSLTRSNPTPHHPLPPYTLQHSKHNHHTPLSPSATLFPPPCIPLQTQPSKNPLPGFNNLRKIQMDFWRQIAQRPRLKVVIQLFKWVLGNVQVKSENLMGAI